MQETLALDKTRNMLWAMGKSCCIFLLIASPVFISLSGAADLLQVTWLDHWLRNAGSTGIFRYIALVTFFSVFGMPRQALAALGGYMFGAMAGCLWATTGLLLGCILTFYIARSLAAEYIRKRLRGRLLALDRTFSLHPFTATLMLRFCPFGNNALCNVSAGISHIRPYPFFAGSVVGYLPQNCVFALLGSGISIQSNGVLAVSAGLFLLSMALSWHIYLSHRHETGEK